MVLYELKKYPAAERAFKKAIHLNQKDARAYNNLGLVLYHLQKKAEAKKAINIAIVLDPKLARIGTKKRKSISYRVAEDLKKKN